MIHDGVYATVGLHTLVVSTSRHHDVLLHTMDDLLRRHKCVGVGEVGLDYYRHQRQRERSNQRNMLSPQFHLAVTHAKLEVIHLRPCEHDKDTGQCLMDCLAIMTAILPKEHKMVVVNATFWGG